MAVPRERRGLWGNWLVEQRAAHGRQTQRAVRETLSKMGHEISEAYYGDFERGKSTPSPEWQEVFRRLWNGEPDAALEPQEVPQSDLAGLIASQAELTAAIASLVEEMKATREAGTAVLPNNVRRVLIAGFEQVDRETAEEVERARQGGGTGVSQLQGQRR